MIADDDDDDDDDDVLYRIVCCGQVEVIADDDDDDDDVLYRIVCCGQVEVIADVCFDLLRVLNLHTQHQDTVLSLTNSVLNEHISDNQVTLSACLSVLMNGDRSLAVYGPRVWNSVLGELRSPVITETNGSRYYLTCYCF